MIVGSVLMSVPTRDKTRQEISSGPASLADQMSDPSLGSVSRVCAPMTCQVYQLERWLHACWRGQQGASIPPQPPTPLAACWQGVEGADSTPTNQRCISSMPSSLAERWGLAGAAGNDEMVVGPLPPPRGSCTASAPWCAFQSGYYPRNGQGADYSYSRCSAGQQYSSTMAISMWMCTGFLISVAAGHGSFCQVQCWTAVQPCHYSMWAQRLYWIPGAGQPSWCEDCKVHCVVIELAVLCMAALLSVAFPGLQILGCTGASGSCLCTTAPGQVFLLFLMLCACLGGKRVQHLHARR